MKWITDGTVRLPKKGEWFAGAGGPAISPADFESTHYLILTPIADGSIVVPPEMVERLRDAIARERAYAPDEHIRQRGAPSDNSYLETRASIDAILSLAAPPKSARLLSLEAAHLRYATAQAIDPLLVELIDAEIEREKAKR